MNWLLIPFTCSLRGQVIEKAFNSLMGRLQLCLEARALIVEICDSQAEAILDGDIRKQRLGQKAGLRRVLPRAGKLDRDGRKCRVVEVGVEVARHVRFGIGDAVIMGIELEQPRPYPVSRTSRKLPEFSNSSIVLRLGRVLRAKSAA